jgi:diphthamide synthase subunit DPH2
MSCSSCPLPPPLLNSSIDWGHYFCVPVLSPFELFVALGEVADSTLWSASLTDDTKQEGESNGTANDVEGAYPMDFYSKSGGPWTNYYESNTNRKIVAYGS